MGWRRLVTSRKDAETGKKRSVRVWQRPKDDPLERSHFERLLSHITLLISLHFS